MPGAPSLSEADQRWLASLARRTLENLAPTGAEAPDESRLIEGQVPPALADRCGAFVTLHNAGVLRGCIGYVTPVSPLYRAVIDNAVNAARRDPRFPPVTPEEVGDLDIEISVLSLPAEIESVDEIVVGRDGLILSKGGARGLLLPQVATDHGWDRETFLDHTCRKAGLAMDTWRHEEVKLETFSALVISEKPRSP